MSINSQRLLVRVYYEDTDFSGRVYHASYLRFFERGRTEWLRALDLQHSALDQTTGIVFAVTQLHVDFHAPAVIDDLLTVATEVEDVRGPVLIFRQNVIRGETNLATGRIEVVVLKGDRPVRPPKEILTRLTEVTRRSPYRSAR